MSLSLRVGVGGRAMRRVPIVVLAWEKSCFGRDARLEHGVVSSVD